VRADLLKETEVLIRSTYSSGIN